MNRSFLALAWLFPLTAAFSCSSRAPESKTTGTNWLECRDDTDCSIITGAHCSDDRFCIDPQGDRVRLNSALIDGTGGAGPGNDAGGSSGDESRNGLSPAVTFAPRLVVPASSDCYSPGQNLEHAHDAGAKGCPCAHPSASLCVSTSGDGYGPAVALTCGDDSHWAAVENGACGTCWTPDQPEHALAQPTNGCSCSASDGLQCLYTEATRYFVAACDEGKWTITQGVNGCKCTADTGCGFQGKCVHGSCAEARCEQDSVLYPVDGLMPDAIGCNVCTCGADGLPAICTSQGCLASCPDATTRGTSCLACGPTDGCALTRSGCFSTCETDDDCENSSCDLDKHICVRSVCI